MSLNSDPVANKAYWENRAQDNSLAKEKVTHSDSNQRFLEIDITLQYLPRDARVLDIGCGNGFSTAIFADYCFSIVGIDYSEAMIDRACKDYGHIKNIGFVVQDILAISSPLQSFDVALSQRCLINLTSWEDQQKAIINIAKVLKPGGVFLLQEGSKQGREHLNQARQAVGLEYMPPVPFNLDFDEDKLWVFIREYFDIVEIRRFGLYDLISRLVHPLLVEPETPKYDAKINEVARLVSSKLRGADELGREFSAFLRRKN